MGVEIRHLAALEAVVETGSFGRAGAELGYSQSAISQQIATLERAAGLQLLERPGGRRPVTPTDAGQRLLRHARRASAAMRAAEADLRALADGEAGTLRVGTFQSVGVRLLPSAMRRYVERWPNVEVRLIEAGYDEELHGAARARRARPRLRDRERRSRLRARPRHLRSLRPPRPRRLGAGAERAADPAPGDRPAAADRLPQRRRGGRSRSSARAGSSSRSSFAPTRAASSRASSARGSATRSCRCSGSTRAPTSPCSRWPGFRRA